MIALGSDHGGYKLKEEIKKYFDEIDIKYKDYGTYSEERTDHPIYSEKVARAIQKGECDSGILLCKSGAGMTIGANKFKGIRAAACFNQEMAAASKADDNINVLVLCSEFTTVSQAVQIIRAWLATEFKGGRYEERLHMIENFENNND